MVESEVCVFLGLHLKYSTLHSAWSTLVHVPEFPSICCSQHSSLNYIEGHSYKCCRFKEWLLDSSQLGRVIIALKVETDMDLWTIVHLFRQRGKIPMFSLLYLSNSQNIELNLLQQSSCLQVQSFFQVGLCLVKARQRGHGEQLTRVGLSFLSHLILPVSNLREGNSILKIFSLLSIKVVSRECHQMWGKKIYQQAGFQDFHLVNETIFYLMYLACAHCFYSGVLWLAFHLQVFSTHDYLFAQARTGEPVCFISDFGNSF